MSTKRKAATVLNFLFVVWLVAFCHMAYAASFKQDVRGYDVESLGWAALMSLFGGALRTIFTLAADNKVVESLFKELGKDAIVAMIAGTIAYIGVEAVRASGAWPVASEVRFAVIVFAGWSRLSFFGWLNNLGTRVTEAVTDKLARTINGGAAVQASTVVPTPDANPAVTPGPAAKPKPFQEK